MISRQYREMKKVNISIFFCEHITLKYWYKRSINIIPKPKKSKIKRTKRKKKTKKN